MSLTGYKIIVTGCARGMGAATLRTYVAAGAHVVGMDVDEEGGAATVDALLSGTPGEATFRRVDVSDPDNTARVFDEATDELDGLDVLAHPAAIQRPGDATSVDVEDWDLMMAVNVRGTMLTNQAAHRHMAATGHGSIINFGSISGLRPEPTAPHTPHQGGPCTPGHALQPRRGVQTGSGSTPFFLP